VDYSSQEIDRPEFEGSSSWKVELSESREVSEGDVVPVWAYVISTNGMHDPLANLEDAPKKARWALVVKMKWQSIKAAESAFP
jgi:hypothetical protein